MGQPAGGVVAGGRGAGEGVGERGVGALVDVARVDVGDQVAPLVDRLTAAGGRGGVDGVLDVGELLAEAG